MPQERKSPRGVEFTRAEPGAESRLSRCGTRRLRPRVDAGIRLHVRGARRGSLGRSPGTQLGRRPTHGTARWRGRGWLDGVAGCVGSCRVLSVKGGVPYPPPTLSPDVWINAVPAAETDARIAWRCSAGLAPPVRKIQAYVTTTSMSVCAAVNSSASHGTPDPVAGPRNVNQAAVGGGGVGCVPRGCSVELRRCVYVFKQLSSIIKGLCKEKKKEEVTPPHHPKS